MLQTSCEVIVVDNASIDNSVAMIEEKFPAVVLIKNKANLGFAAANNKAINHAKGKYILLLNSDTRIKDNTVVKLLNFISDDSSVGAVGCKLLNNDSSLQQSVGYFPTLTKIFLWMTFIDDIPLLRRFIKPYHVAPSSFYSKNQEVDWVTGACLLIRSEMIKQTGLLDEKIFMYGEEVEWCYRIKKIGYKVKYFSGAEVYHTKGASSENIQGAGIVEEFKSLQYFYNKHFPSWQGVFLKILLKAGSLLRYMTFGIILGNPHRKSLYAKAFKVVG